MHLKARVRIFSPNVDGRTIIISDTVFFHRCLRWPAPGCQHPIQVFFHRRLRWPGPSTGLWSPFVKETMTPFVKEAIRLLKVTASSSAFSPSNTTPSFSPSSPNTASSNKSEETVSEETLVDKKRI